MRQKKLLTGALAAALVLSTGAVAYAAGPQRSDQAAVQVKGEASAVREGAQSFDEADLPAGVQFAQQVSEGGEGENWVESTLSEKVEGTLSLDETELPAGVQFADAVSSDVANGVMILE